MSRSTRVRQRQRGSAYVEALVVTSLLIFLWMGALAFGRLYALKLATLVDARAHAWLATAGHCGPQRDPLSRALDELTRSPDGARAQALLEAARKATTRGVSHSSVRSRRGLLPFVDRDHEAFVQTTTRFACNESSALVASDTQQLTGQRWVSELLRRAKP
jgi:hypothetical protein